MPSAIRTFIIALTVFAIAGCAQASKVKIETIWREYASAVQTSRGSEASEFASDASLRHFAQLKEFALEGGADMKSLTLYDEVSVYYLRSKYGADALSRFSDRDIMKILVNAELLGIPHMNQLMIEEIRVYKKTAYATLTSGEADTFYEVTFLLENGDWKVDYLSLARSRDMVLANRLISYSGTRDDVIDEILKSVGIRDGLSEDLTEPVRS